MRGLFLCDEFPRAARRQRSRALGRIAEWAATALSASALIQAGLDPVAEAYIARRIAEAPTMLGAGSAPIDHDLLIGRARLGAA